MPFLLVVDFMALLKNYNNGRNNGKKWQHYSLDNGNVTSKVQCAAQWPRLHLYFTSWFGFQDWGLVEQRGTTLVLHIPHHFIQITVGLIMEKHFWSWVSSKTSLNTLWKTASFQVMKKMWARERDRERRRETERESNRSCLFEGR